LDALNSLSHYLLNNPENIMTPIPVPPEFENILRQFCTPRPVFGAPLQLWTTDDRWVLGRYVPSGPHEANMAMWAQPFSGGETLAQYIFDNASQFSGRKIVDMGSGSGIAAIAAAMADGIVTAIDSSLYATYAIRANAQLNGIKNLNIVMGSAFSELEILEEADIIMAGDIFYHHLALSNLAYGLSDLAQNGKIIYATSQDEDLAKTFKNIGVSVEILNGSAVGLDSFIRFDQSHCCNLRGPDAQHHHSSSTPPASMNYSQRLQARMRASRIGNRLEKKL
jgi:predicted nicotinamide N-methyase